MAEAMTRAIESTTPVVQASAAVAVAPATSTATPASSRPTFYQQLETQRLTHDREASEAALGAMSASMPGATPARTASAVSSTLAFAGVAALVSTPSSSTTRDAA